MRKLKDLVVIGAGPAGLSAGLYAGLYGLDTLIIGETIGGELKLAPLIIDYPGVSSIKGVDWLANILSQIKETGVEIIEKKVTKISPSTTEKLQKFFIVSASNRNYSAASIILAVGNKNRRPNYTGYELALKIGIQTTRDNFISSNNPPLTNLAGAFVAGNCIAYPQATEQLIDAASQGAKAASAVYQYLKKQNSPTIWGKTAIPNK